MRRCRPPVFTVFTTVLFAWSFASHASLTLSEREVQRRLFLNAEKKLKSGDQQFYQRHQSTLQHYPLFPYLQGLALTYRLHTLSQRDVDHYVTRYPDLPHSQRLQRRWLNYLAQEKRWAAYLTAYEKTNSTRARYRCLQGWALLQQGDQPKAWAQATKLWLVGHSQHKACDPLFAAWKQAEQLTQSLIFDRFWLAVANNNMSLARYLDQFIVNATYQQSVKRFWQIHHNPRTLVTASGHALPDIAPVIHQRIWQHGLKRLAHQDRPLAIRLWLANRQTLSFTDQQITRLDRWLAMQLATDFAEDASQQIARIDPTFRYPLVTEWRIRLALARQDWQAVLVLIGKLPAPRQQKSRWRYWQAVAHLGSQANNELTETIDPTHQATATALFQALSQERGFYGFLVADRDNRPFQLNDDDVAIDQQSLQQLMGTFDALARIQEWVAHQRFHEAQSELNRLKPRLSDQQRKLIAYLAQRWDWHHQAILTAAREALWNDLDLRFPTPLSDLFNQYASQRQLDSHWVIAIARQESAFNPTARSQAGARGLMQLMPTTAKYTAKRHRIRYQRAADLYRPTTNIALGTAHLAKLTEQFDHNRVFATAAYNAGASRVQAWLEARGHLPLDVWIETIPYDETRQYVQNVLAFRVIYSSRQHHVTSLLLPQETARLALNELSDHRVPSADS